MAVAMASTTMIPAREGSVVPHAEQPAVFSAAPQFGGSLGRALLLTLPNSGRVLLVDIGRASVDPVQFIPRVFPIHMRAYADVSAAEATTASASTSEPNEQASFDTMYSRVSSGSSRDDVARQLSRLASLRRKSRLDAHRQMVEHASPEEVLSASLHHYELERSDEWLKIGAAILRDMGARSWATLVDAVRIGRIGRPIFLRALAANKGVSLGERVRMMLLMTRDADPDMRATLTELAYDFPPDFRDRLLHNLAAYSSTGAPQATAHDDAAQDGEE